MNWYVDEIIEIVKSTGASAMSGVQDFEKSLTFSGAMEKGRAHYARDYHYRLYGFWFIRSAQDIEAFLQSLDEDSLRVKCTGSVKRKCAKAKCIRISMKRPWIYRGGVLEQFKAVAARERRVNCRCHQTGSFKFQPW